MIKISLSQLCAYILVSKANSKTIGSIMHPYPTELAISPTDDKPMMIQNMVF